MHTHMHIHTHTHTHTHTQVSGQRPHENPDNAPRYQSNNYAILGSLFMFVCYPSFNCYWAPASLRVYVATNTFVALISGGMFSFIWANYLYPEGPAVIRRLDGILAHSIFSFLFLHLPERVCVSLSLSLWLVRCVCVVTPKP